MEERIYIVCANRDIGLNDILEMNDDEFQEEAENQGFVWSSMEYFCQSWNESNVFPPQSMSEMRIIKVK